MRYDRLSHLILRLGVAFAFLYPPINAWWNPYDWIGYFPNFVRGHVPDLVLLHSFGALEIAIALWLISGKRIWVPSIAATFILLAIVILDQNNFIVIFRDLSIAASALALALMEKPRAASNSAGNV